MKCAKCKCDLSLDITGEHKTKDGWLCDDCYYEKLGDVIEKHGIGVPHRPIRPVTAI